MSKLPPTPLGKKSKIPIRDNSPAPTKVPSFAKGKLTRNYPPVSNTEYFSKNGGIKTTRKRATTVEALAKAVVPTAEEDDRMPIAPATSTAAQKVYTPEYLSEMLAAVLQRMQRVLTPVSMRQHINMKGHIISIISTQRDIEELAQSEETAVVEELAEHVSGYKDSLLIMHRGVQGGMMTPIVDRTAGTIMEAIIRYKKVDIFARYADYAGIYVKAVRDQALKELESAKWEGAIFNENDTLCRYQLMLTNPKATVVGDALASEEALYLKYKNMSETAQEQFLKTRKAEIKWSLLFDDLAGPMLIEGSSLRAIYRFSGDRNKAFHIGLPDLFLAGRIGDIGERFWKDDKEIELFTGPEETREREAIQACVAKLTRWYFTDESREMYADTPSNWAATPALHKAILDAKANNKKYEDLAVKSKAEQARFAQQVRLAEEARVRGDIEAAEKLDPRIKKDAPPLAGGDKKKFKVKNLPNDFSQSFSNLHSAALGFGKAIREHSVKYPDGGIYTPPEGFLRDDLIGEKVPERATSIAQVIEDLDRFTKEAKASEFTDEFTVTGRGVPPPPDAGEGSSRATITNHDITQDKALHDTPGWRRTWRDKWSIQAYIASIAHSYSSKANSMLPIPCRAPTLTLTD
jgi:primosomal protein N''